MPKKLLNWGFILLLLGSISAIIFCIIALFDPYFSPFLLMFCSTFLLISGFILIVIDNHNDFKRRQKIYEDTEYLIIKYHQKQQKMIIEKILINKILSELQDFNGREESPEDL